MVTLYYVANGKIIAIMKVDYETAKLYDPVDYALLNCDIVEKVVGKEEYDRNYNSFYWGE